MYQPVGLLKWEHPSRETGTTAGGSTNTCSAAVQAWRPGASCGTGGSRDGLGSSVSSKISAKIHAAKYVGNTGSARRSRVRDCGSKRTGPLAPPARRSLPYVGPKPDTAKNHPTVPELMGPV
eukprot:6076412-Prymnesium_polylepis.2